MLFKTILIVSSCLLSTFGDCAKLLRKPKVYNAIITTDEQLTPSRAFPIVQPVIQPAIPFYNSYPIGIYESGQNDVNEKKLSRSQERMDDDVNNQQNDDNQQPTTKSPIPLNQYGFPPSLIPLQKVPSYPFSYPFIYDSYGNIQTIQQFPVLPPNFYPQDSEQRLPPIEQPLFQVGARRFNDEHDQHSNRDEKSLSENENSLPQVPTEAIKNNSNKNSEIPDVAVPPIPFSIKKN